MTVWVVRAGSGGEREEKALEEGLCFIGWGEMPDLSEFKTKEQIREKLDDVNFDRKPGTNRNHSDQIWAFLDYIKKKRYYCSTVETSARHCIWGGHR